MARLSNREKILASGLDVVHAHGFAGASVRDIVQAAGVPQGSFSNHFGSKEAFGLEIIDRYCEAADAFVAATLLNEDLPPLERLAAFMDGNRQTCDKVLRDGCLLGNLAGEATNESEQIRRKLEASFAASIEPVARCLRAAIANGDVPADLDADETAAFIIGSIQGANLLAKTSRDSAPLDRVKRIVFEKVLR